MGFKYCKREPAQFIDRAARRRLSSRVSQPGSGVPAAGRAALWKGAARFRRDGTYMRDVASRRDGLEIYARYTRWYLLRSGRAGAPPW